MTSMASMAAEDVVVAAALIEHGRLLGARRSRPAESAGRWELPGGKVHPGEAAADALVREIHEELGCEVEVGARVPGVQRLSGGRVLHAYECRLKRLEPTGAGEPVPSEHDAIRWLAPEELDEVTWLPADLPFVETLRRRLLDGERLPGGNVGGAVRIGATVRRPTGAWTAAVHALLAHVSARGLDGVPRVLGFDSRGREVLTFTEGRVLGHANDPAADVEVHDIGAWLRRYHAAVADFEPPPGSAWRNAARALTAGEIVCHHDVAPYNVVVQDDRLVAVIDWDMAGPGLPLEDLSFAAWNCAPLHTDIGVQESVRRLLLLCDGYGDADPVAVLRGVVPRIEAATARISAGQRAGDIGMLNLREVGEPERSRRMLQGLETRLPALEQHLEAVLDDRRS